VIEACTITLPSRLGMMCRKTITERRVPSEREASTYSSVRMTSVSARTMRANVGL